MPDLKNPDRKVNYTFEDTCLPRRFVGRVLEHTLRYDRVRCGISNEIHGEHSPPPPRFRTRRPDSNN